MKEDVMFVIDQILHKLSMEEEQFKEAVEAVNVNEDIFDKKNLLFDKVVEDVSAVATSETQKYSNCKLNTSFNKTDNSGNGDTSSGIGDSDNLKSFNSDSPTKLESVTNFQIDNETSDVKDPELNDFNGDNINDTSRIFTSTPKKNKNDSKDVSAKNSFDCVNLEEKISPFEKVECLNRTIEEAIDKYEKATEGKKMEDAFVQTSFEKSISNCCCKIHLTNVKTDEFPAGSDEEEPLPKKAKIEIDCKTSENADGKTNPTFVDQPSKAKVTISTVPVFPVKGNNEINRDEEKNSFYCKIPRIRVGLSKRAKIRPQT